MRERKKGTEGERKRDKEEKRGSKKEIGVEKGKKG